MPTETLEAAEPVIAPLELTSETQVTPPWLRKIERGVLSLIVVAAAMLLGTFVAFIIALAVGWIQIGC